MSPDEGSLQPICACMGHPVSGNPTQYMMERAFAHHDLDWRYLTLDVSPQNLQSAINGIRAFGFAGASVITPHKANVTAALDDLSESARLVEAVNCICRDGDRLIGENTEGAGFMRSLRGTLDPAGSSVLILGAGSTARAIGVELARAGCQQIQIVNRSRENGERLMNLLNEHFAPHPMEPAVPTSNDDAGEGPEKGTAGSATTGEPNKNLAIDTTDSAPPPADGARQQLATFAEWVQEFDIPPGTDIVINATSIGSFDEDARVPVAIDTLEGAKLAADVVLHPTRTRFLDEAKSHGCEVLDGLAISVNQGALAFQLWTGVDPDLSVMQDALEEFFGV